MTIFVWSLTCLLISFAWVEAIWSFFFRFWSSYGQLVKRFNVVPLSQLNLPKIELSTIQMNCHKIDCFVEHIWNVGLSTANVYVQIHFFPFVVFFAFLRFFWLMCLSVFLVRLRVIIVVTDIIVIVPCQNAVKLISRKFFNLWMNVFCCARTLSIAYAVHKFNMRLPLATQLKSHIVSGDTTIKNQQPTQNIQNKFVTKEEEEATTKKSLNEKERTHKSNRKCVGCHKNGIASMCDMMRATLVDFNCVIGFQNRF